MNQKDFKDYTMFCNSTGNQTVNLLPLLQLKCKKCVIFSTLHTDKNKITERFREVLEEKKIKSKVCFIEPTEEKDLLKLLAKFKKEAEGCEKIIWNIAGGQKIPSASFLLAFSQRMKKDDFMVYTEASPPEIWFFNKELIAEKRKTSVELTLQEILKLYNYETNKNDKPIFPPDHQTEETKENLKTGKKALEYYLNSEIFRDAFFGFMKPLLQMPASEKELLEEIKRTLNQVTPKYNEIKLNIEGYRKIEENIKKYFSNLNDEQKKEEAIKKLKIIAKPEEIYNSYWNEIKRNTIEKTMDNLKGEQIKLLSKDYPKEEIEKLKDMIKDIGGETKNNLKYKGDILHFSRIERPGILFEWMVLSSIIEEVEKDEDIRNSISQIYHSVKTKKLNSKDTKFDAEHDIVIVTKFGTLIIIEIKTYDFEGKTAQAQEGLAYKKSGPYGKATIIGPIISTFYRDDNKEPPPYIDGKIKDQEETARQNNIPYYYLDKIKEMLEEQLFLKEK